MRLLLWSNNCICLCIISKSRIIMKYCNTFSKDIINKADKATTLAGYGITDAYTKSAANGKFITGAREAYNVNTLYNAGIWMTASGSNVPSGSNYGVCLTLPYRQLFNNSKPDFGAQIFLPNGDDETKPNSMYFRTSLADTWNAWQEVATESAVSGWGFTKNTGTVTGVKINGTTKNPSSGVVDLGYINKQLSTSTSTAMTLSPNIYYRNTSTSLSTLTITFASETSALYNSLILNEYFVEFTTSSSGTTVSLPSSVKWANGETPTFENGKTYQISIVNNLGVCTKFG